MVHQETEGLLSPLIRDVRLRAVSSMIAAGTTVVDLGCGEGYLREFLPRGCRYYGVDRVSPSSPDRFSGFLLSDIADTDAFSRLQQWLPRRPDYVTCIAVLEHLTNPAAFVAQCGELLAPDGKFIGTTPHPRGRQVHELLAKAGICSRHGAEEHEQFLGRGNLQKIAAKSRGTLTLYRQFLLGLNQLFVIAYPPSEDVPGRSIPPVGAARETAS